MLHCVAARRVSELQLPRSEPEQPAPPVIPHFNPCLVDIPCYEDHFKSCLSSDKLSLTCHSCEKLKALHAQIEEAKAALQDLLHQLHELKPTVNKDHPSIVDCMPLEVATLVFDFYCHSGVEECTPLILGAVCQTWHRLVWSSPLLWTHVFISVSIDVTEGKVQLAWEWLSRTGQLPLSIRFNLVEPDMKLLSSKKGPDYSRVEPLINLVNEHAFHWHTLHLDEVPDGVIGLFSDSEVASPMLDTLSLLSYDDWWAIGTIDIKNASPRVLSISPFDFNLEDLKWTNITCLSSTIGLDEILRVFRLAPRLESCMLELNSDGCYMRCDDISDPVIPPQLHSFAIKILHELKTNNIIECLAHFFNRVSFPALVKLTYHAHYPHCLPSNALISFFKRSSCQLEELSILLPYTTGEEMVEIAKAVPSIVHLSLTLDSDLLPWENLNMTPFLHALTAHFSPTNPMPTIFEPLLPHLE